LAQSFVIRAEVACHNRPVTDEDLLRRLDQTIDLNSRAFQQVARSHTRLVESHRRLEATVDDLRDQIAANTKALLALIDRLGPAAGGAT